MSTDLDDLRSLLDEDQLQFVAEEKERIHHIVFYSGKAELKTVGAMQNTIHYLGGIGIPIDTLSPEHAERACAEDRVVEISEGNRYAVFPHLDFIVLATRQIRRYGLKVDNKYELQCGTNDAGMNAVGWSGVSCDACKFKKQGASDKRKDLCKSKYAFVVYIPSLDYTGKFEFNGSNYITGSDFANQIARLKREYGKVLGVPRVNSYFFKTVVGPSREWLTGEENNQYRIMEFEKVGAPYNWDAIKAPTPEIAKAKAVWKEIEDIFKSMYTGHNSRAALATADPLTLPISESVKQLTAAPAPTMAPGAPPPLQVVEAVPVPAAAAPAVASESSIINF